MPQANCIISRAATLLLVAAVSLSSAFAHNKQCNIFPSSFYTYDTENNRKSVTWTEDGKTIECTYIYDRVGNNVLCNMGRFSKDDSREMEKTGHIVSNKS